jgi:hypothetical protein
MVPHYTGRVDEPAPCPLSYSLLATWLGTTFIFGSQAGTSTARASPRTSARKTSRHVAHGP